MISSAVKLTPRLLREPSLCPDGYYLKGDSCKPCPRGFACSKGAARPCKVGELGSTDLLLRGDCEKCPLGHICHDSGSDPIACPAGIFEAVLPDHTYLVCIVINTSLPECF